MEPRERTFAMMDELTFAPPTVLKHGRKPIIGINIAETQLAPIKVFFLHNTFTFNSCLFELLILPLSLTARFTILELSQTMGLSACRQRTRSSLD